MLKNLFVAIVGGGILNYLFALDVTTVDDEACGSVDGVPLVGDQCTELVGDLVARGFPFTFLEGQQDVSIGDYSVSLGPAALNFGFWAVVALLLYWVISSAMEFAVKLIVVGLIVGAIGFFFGFDRLF